MELQNMTGTTETLQDGSASHMSYANPDVYSLIPYPIDHWTRAEARKCYVTDSNDVLVTLIDVKSGNNGNY